MMRTKNKEGTLLMSNSPLFSVPEGFRVNSYPTSKATFLRNTTAKHPNTGIKQSASLFRVIIYNREYMLAVFYDGLVNVVSLNGPTQVERMAPKRRRPGSKGRKFEVAQVVPSGKKETVADILRANRDLTKGFCEA